MKRYGEREFQVLVRHECVEGRCDMCGRAAELPGREPLMFEYCPPNGSSGGRLSVDYSLDGESWGEALDLCDGCAEWLIKEILSGRLKRTEGENR